MLDCHVHTSNSPDAPQGADNSVKAMCERAKELKLKALAITEHCEVNKFYSIDYYKAIPNDYDNYDFDVLFEKSMQENTALKEEYPFLLSGVELGQATHDIPVADKIVSDSRLDFVIASMHQLPNRDDFAFIDYSKEDVNALMERNFLEVYKLCEWGKFDVIGHLTYALRYIEGDHGITVDLAKFDDIFAEIFKLLVKNGKGIEINTSGLRQKYGDTFPTLKYVKMFKDFGGEYVTVGSDSHCIADLGKGIERGIFTAKQAGFDYVFYYKNRKPQPVVIN
jgi:histidinol-phosphatase (PHP family)